MLEDQLEESTVRSEEELENELAKLQDERQEISNLTYSLKQLTEEKLAINKRYTELQHRIEQLETETECLRQELDDVDEPSLSVEELRAFEVEYRQKQERRDMLIEKQTAHQRTLSHLLHKQQSLVEPERVSSVEDEIQRAKEKEQQARQRWKELERHSDYLLHQKYKLRKEKAEESLKTCEEEILALQMFLKKFLQAEAIAIQNVIHTINLHVQNYLDVFFEEDPLQAKLVTEKTSKSTKIQSTHIHIEIFYKGNVIDLSTPPLSGGEYDRVVLAFVLALSDMNTSPITILDECVGSLDQATATVVCDYLKNQTSDNKLVLLIAHQIVTGMFDKIITLN